IRDRTVTGVQTCALPISTLAWAAYQFTDYRDGMAPASLTRAPGLQVRRSSEQLELTATVHLGGLTGLSEAPALRLALAAVIEDRSEERRVGKGGCAVWEA